MLIKLRENVRLEKLPKNIRIQIDFNYVRIYTYPPPPKKRRLKEAVSKYFFKKNFWC
jgi:hypothetical protein